MGALQGIALFTAFVLALASTSVAQAGSAVLSEFLADNEGSLLDQDGDSSDWIEIHNSGASPVSLLGWQLTDSASNLSKWTFPAVTLAPGALLVVFASDKNLTNPAGQLHTNFKLSKDGEYLALVQPDGVIATQYAPTFPAQLPNVSYGTSATGAVGYFDPPTPGVANGSSFVPLPQVSFSHDRGLPASPFSLSLGHVLPGAAIRYTLDGSKPSASHGTPYGGPISISDTVIVRAIAILGSQQSQVATHSYIFPTSVAAQTHQSVIARGFPADWLDQNGVNWKDAYGDPHPGSWYGLDPAIVAQFSPAQLVDWLDDLPTVSLVMEKERWFGYEPAAGLYGIYVNSTQQTDDWDQACSAEWLTATGAEFQIDCGVGVQGGSSTSTANRNQLSLALKFKSEFGPSKLNFKLFDDSPLDKFDYLVLDAANQQSINTNGPASYKLHSLELQDHYMSRLQLAMGGLAPRFRPVHLYLNGIYWGVYNIHERPDERFAAAYLGGEPEEYDWVRLGFVAEGNNTPYGLPNPGAWHVAVAIAENGVEPGVLWNGEPAFDVLSRYLDYDAYIDYLLVNYYGGNLDWPGKNWMGTLHARNSASLTDVDSTPLFQFHSWDAETTLYWSYMITSVGDGWYDRTQLTSNWPGSAVFFATQLRKHPEFRLRFADRAHRHIFNGGPLYVEPGFETAGTVFDPAAPERNRPAALFYEIAEPVRGPIALEYARWGNYFFSSGQYQPSHWAVERARILNEFCAIRTSILHAQLQNSLLYPTVAAPVHHASAGIALASAGVTITAESGTIYYTTDGTDPRQAGGAISPSAQIYSGALAISAPLHLKSRALAGTEWSALNDQHISTATNLGFGGDSGPTLLPAGGSLAAGSYGTLEVAHAPAGATIWLCFGLSSEPTPLFGGTLVPNPVLGALPGAADENGSWRLKIPDGNHGSAVFYVQAIALAAGSPARLSNALEISLAE